MKPDLLEMGIRETLHEEILDQLFQVIHTAKTYEVPILVSIYDGTLEALEQVRLDAAIIEQTLMCAICWKDFATQDIDDQLMVTRMPCSHYFHGYCISGCTVIIYVPCADTRCQWRSASHHHQRTQRSRGGCLHVLLLKRQSHTANGICSEIN
ncbi:hypothetical protein ACLB2K_056882 [Fragaria x ananassa]